MFFFLKHGVEMTRYVQSSGKQQNAACLKLAIFCKFSPERAIFGVFGDL